jgi:RNA polymerase-binding transcription factor DksA
MSKKMVIKLKELLLNRKREIFKQIAHLEMGRNAQKERVTELGDAAQKEDLIRLLDHLVERGNEEVREINIALEKMAAGKYGNCEICEKRIETKRLKALPETRLCRKCAQNLEHALELRQHPHDEIMDDALLDEYRNLLDEDILKGMAQLPIDTKSHYLSYRSQKKK